MSATTPPDPLLFAAAFNCFYIETRPGGDVMLTIHTNGGGKVTVRLDWASAESLAHTCLAAAVRSKLQPPEMIADARVPQPPQETVADKGQITEQVDRVEDGGKLN